MLRNTGNIPYSIRADNPARDAESNTPAEQGSNLYSLRKLTTGVGGICTSRELNLQGF